MLLFLHYQKNLLNRRKGFGARNKFIKCWDYRFTDSGVEKYWVVIAIAADDWYALIAEEVRSDRYSGFFTTNRNLTNRYLNIIKEALNIEIEIWKVCIISIWII